MAAVSIAIIPVILFLRQHSVLVPKSRLWDLGYFGLVGIAVVSAVGTFARTALIGFVVVGVFLFLQTKRKLLFLACASIVAIGLLTMTAKSWGDRVATTVDYNEEGSALGRILVWKWTIGYVLAHPLGGGFNSYLIDVIEFPATGDQGPVIVHGKAFHNIYIEVMGETGFPGLAMFVGIQGLALIYLRQAGRRARARPDLGWCYDLAKALTTSLLVMFACGNFIGIAFQPMLWYLLALPVCLREYVHRVERTGRSANLAQRVATQLGSPLPELVR